MASRPLRVEELAEFLAFDFEAGPIPKFREDWHIEEPLEAVLSTCSTLLALVNVNDSSVIQFSHFSVKEFLTSTRFGEKNDTISSRYHVSMTPAHTLVAQACLGILLHLDENVTKDSLKKFPLAEYAAEHWVQHARFEGVSENVEGMKQLFDGSKSHLAIWVWIHEPNWRQRLYPRAERPSSPLGSPLHYAAFCGLYSVVKFLAIEHPQDVHSRGFDDESTPLHLASRMGHLEVARLLVEHGADVTVENQYGRTPLHWAVQDGGSDVVRFLVEHGADVTVQDYDGSTPLHWAAREGSVDVVRLLVKHGANVTVQDNNGWTPLLWAAREGSVDVARFLLERGADATVKDKYESSPLHLAVLEGSVDLARFLIEHGADVTAKDEHGSTPLHLTVLEGNVDVARLLVEHGADVNARDEDGWTPLYQAVQEGKEDLARWFVEHGAGRDGPEQR